MNGVARHSNRQLGWLSRNRWGLGLLPLATVLALAASSDRVKTYFWEADLHEPQVVEQGEWVSYSEPYTLETGEKIMSLRARLESVRTLSAEEATGSMNYRMPEKTSAVEVTLAVEADPATPLVGCSMALRDKAGNRYTFQSTQVAGGQPTSVCVPADATGPTTLFGKVEMPEPDEKQRPAKYTVKPVWVIPADADVTEVDLWWEIPHYLAFRAAD